jgi:CheY-like chemotaxis protein
MEPQMPPRVLVVDDNPDSAQSVGTLLECLGAEVEIALDGPSALRALERRPPRIVLLDLDMPGMDGFEVARRIRARDEWRELLVVALTGWGQRGDRRRTLQHGFDYHLLKPAELDALTALLAAAPRPFADPERVERADPSTSAPPLQQPEAVGRGR